MEHETEETGFDKVVFGILVLVIVIEVLGEACNYYCVLGPLGVKI